MVKEEAIQIDDENNANLGGKDMEPEFTSMLKEEVVQIDDENNAKQGGKGKEQEITSMLNEEAIQIDNENNANQGGKGKEQELTSMLNEEAIQIDDENNANQGKELEFTSMVKEEAIQIDDENNANQGGKGKDPVFTSLLKEEAIQIYDENSANQGGKGMEPEFTNMLKDDAIQINDENNANQGGKCKEPVFTSMVKEEVIQIDGKNSANQEKDNSADGEIITEEFTETAVVKKGKGTPLKDICNVVSKLEEKVHSFATTLHYILYGEHDKVEDFKKDVLEFSGFASDNDEEGQRDKVKERLERCPKDMLKQLYNVFDVPAANVLYLMSKKKLIQVLLDFLEAPHGATEETERSGKEIPSRKRRPMISEKKLYSETDISTSFEIFHEEDQEEEDDDNAPSDGSEEMWGSEKSGYKSQKSRGKGVNFPKQIPDTNEGLRGDSTSSIEKFTKSVWELENSNKKKKLTERQVAQGGDKQPKEWCDPSYEEIQKAISFIVDEMDITTATFSDVLEELDNHFEMDISPRKDAIMVMIEEELYRLADEIQEEETREENHAEKINGENSKEVVPYGAPVQK